MRDLHTLLDEIEPVWRDEVSRDFPIREDTEIVRKTKPNGRDWTFSTDLEKIFAHIANSENLQRKFETTIAKYWGDEPEKLARDTLHYLLDHELGHMVEAPFSTRRSTGSEDNDETKIHQAMRRGLLKAEPKLSPSEQLAKVSAAQNGVKDFILDNRVYLDKKGQSYRDDIIPTWDVLELEKSPVKTNFYTVTRLLYGLLYGPDSTHKFFLEKAGKKKGREVAGKALSALVKKTVDLSQSEKETSLVDKVRSLFSSSPKKSDEKSSNEYRVRLEGYITDIRGIFVGEDRYAGIERIMEVLGPYIEKGMQQSRPDLAGGEGSGGSPQDIMQDLLDDMSPEDQNAFIEDVVKNGPKTLSDFGEGKPNSTSGDSNSTDEVNSLDIIAAHEFYKRNHPKVKIIGGNKVGETVIVGKEEYWNLKRSSVITEEELSSINLTYVSRFQQKTGLPILIPLEVEPTKTGRRVQLYRYNEYELREKEVKDIKFVDQSLDVPDVVELYVDSSDSMGTSRFKINDGSGWDMLSYVTYGFVDALEQGGRLVGKTPKIRIHNVANQQRSSELISVEEFLAGDLKTIKTFFRPENGYSEENLNIQEYKDGVKRAYVVVTDGNLGISGRTEREAPKMKRLAKDPQNDVVLFEIGETYDLGRAVKNDPNVHYHQVHNKQRMLQQGVEVILGSK